VKLLYHKPEFSPLAVVDCAEVDRLVKHSSCVESAEFKYTDVEPGTVIGDVSIQFKDTPTLYTWEGVSHFRWNKLWISAKKIGLGRAIAKEWTGVSWGKPLNYSDKIDLSPKVEEQDLSNLLRLSIHLAKNKSKVEPRQKVLSPIRQTPQSLR